MEILQQRILGMPLWVIAIVVGGAGIGLAYVLKKNSGSTSGAQTLGQSAQPVPSEIDPYTGVPYNIESQPNPNNNGLPAYYGGPGVDSPVTPTPTDPGPVAHPGPNPIPGPLPAPAPTPAPGTTIRLKDTSGQFAYWDNTHPQGIPIRPTPGSTQITGYAGYGTPITLSSQNPVTAQYNNQGQYVGWYPVQGGGWVQSVDVVQPKTGTGPVDQATPWWPIMSDIVSARGY